MLYTSLEKMSVLRIMYKVSTTEFNPTFRQEVSMKNRLEVDSQFILEAGTLQLKAAIQSVRAMTDVKKLEFARFVLDYYNDFIMHPSEIDGMYASFDTEGLLEVFEIIKQRQSLLMSPLQKKADDAAYNVYTDLNKLISAFAVSGNELNEAARNKAVDLDCSIKRFHSPY